MSQYVYNLENLKPGDILLERYDDRLSQFIMKKTGSHFSHAILYAGNGSNLEATLDLVLASNISRTILENTDFACVYRLKEEYYSTEIIDKAIEYARVVYGTEYTKKDARSVFTGIKQKEENRQTCTRMVAQAYAYAGIKIVDDPDFCSILDIESSPYLEIVDNPFREATPEDVEFAKTEDVTLKMSSATMKMLEDVRTATGSDIQTLEQVLQFIIDHPEFDQCVSKIVKDSGYLDVWKFEKSLNPWSYDISLYCEKFKGQTVEVAYDNFRDLQNIWLRFNTEYQKYRNMPQDLCQLQFVKQQVALYKCLLNNTCEKMMVVIQILQDAGIE